MSLFRSFKLRHPYLPTRHHISNRFVLYYSSESFDHRALARQQKLLINSSYSPGSPIFQPAGTHILNSLIACLRAHYPAYGFQEVISPSMYKSSLWKKSGHWDNYADNMFSVNTRDGAIQDNGKDEDWGLKPMNCPGHCLIFDSEPRSHRQLPIRYADFSALHRNEISGALSGLTRVRRFHQDDGHIFCMPHQVETEILRSLEFIELMYKDIFRLPAYRLVLSTRPKESYIGAVEDWDRAETQLKSALDATGSPWTLDEGEGAFYGPKIDIILQDSQGKEHQTATIQLDFQLPQRFDLEYQTGTENATPVMIHRAIFGSLERFLAILIEHYAGSYPFWLSPKPLSVLTVGTSEQEIAYAQAMVSYWCDITSEFEPSSSSSSSFSKISPKTISRAPFPVSTDFSARPLGEKLRSAHDMNHNFYCVVGPRDIESETVSIDVGCQTRGEEIWAKYLSTNSKTSSNKVNKRFSIPVTEAKVLWNSLRDLYF